MDIVWRSLLGGVFIGLVLLLSRKCGPAVGGLFILFPFASLPIFYFIGATEGTEKLRQTLLHSLIAVPVWVAYTAALYWATQRFKLVPSIILSLGVWVLAALLLVLCRRMGS